MLSQIDILNFWFKEIEPKQWWVKDEKFDKLIKKLFLSTHKKSMAGELYMWRDNARGRLAEIIVLDQFSRNMFRGQPASFASDALALCLAQTAVTQNAQNDLMGPEISFLYMPFMHSESKKIQEVAQDLFSQPEVQSNQDIALKHKAIIDRFGRYPHRNKILSRDSTAEELEFLKQANSSF